MPLSEYASARHVVQRLAEKTERTTQPACRLGATRWRVMALPRLEEDQMRNHSWVNDLRKTPKGAAGPDAAARTGVENAVGIAFHK